MLAAFGEQSADLVLDVQTTPPASVSVSSEKGQQKKEGGNKNCAVPFCMKSGYRIEENHGKVTYHRFPKDAAARKEWCIKIRREENKNGFVIRNHTYVCSLHFRPEDFEHSLFSGRRFLLPSAVPSVFVCWNGLNNFNKKPKARRVLIRADHHETDHRENLDKSNDENMVTSCEENAADKASKLEEELKLMTQENDLLMKENSNLLKQLDECKFSIDNIRDSDICFYTGFPCRATFNTVLEFLDPGVMGENIIYCNHKSKVDSQVKLGRPRKLTPANEFLLFMCRVRLGLFEQDLATRFRISISTVSDIIISWANFIYLKLGAINIWASRASIDKFMPESFKRKYPKTRIIIDATEIKLEMPSSLMLKSQSYSNYKSSNTLKGLIGISPSGCVTFVSQLYTGCISDREITVRSGLLKLPFQRGDVVMADKGFDIQDLLDPIGVHLNIPPFLGKYSQMTPDDVRETQSIAAERIHVERLINKIKNFHIFDSVIPLTLAGSINQLWGCCALLTLFQNPIISQTQNISVNNIN